MPWIESHTELRDHPKVSVLADEMGWNIFETIGRLHGFWYWCLLYAPNGDLRKFNDAQVGGAVMLNGAQAVQFVKAMVRSCWIDRSNGIFRVHDWPDYAGRYLQESKFKRTPEKWLETQKLYELECPRTVQGQSELPTNQPYQPRRECTRLHGIPNCEGDVVIYGATLNPPVAEDRCKAFWGHYEGQARTNPNGDVFWVTSGDAVVTNWKAKLPAFASEKAATYRSKQPRQQPQPQSTIPGKRL